MHPIGVTDGGEFVFTTSPQTARAAELFKQLIVWRQRGYHVTLQSVGGGDDSGWVLRLETPDSFVMNDKPAARAHLRYVSAVTSSPEYAIENSLKAVQP
jgi:hypothetical protein